MCLGIKTSEILFKLAKLYVRKCGFVHTFPYAVLVQVHFLLHSHKRHKTSDTSLTQYNSVSISLATISLETASQQTTSPRGNVITADVIQEAEESRGPGPHPWTVADGGLHGDLQTVPEWDRDVPPVQKEGKNVRGGRHCHGPACCSVPSGAAGQLPASWFETSEKTIVANLSG